MPESTPTLHDAAARASAAGADSANALPQGHRLHEFELRGVIGVGGFGIVYRAFDHSLERDVAIKEYMPSALAGRSGKHQVSLLSASHSETFALGMSSFVNEAKLLAKFDHASLVKVHRFWEDNGTAYMVMPLYRGLTLRALRQQSDACPDGAWLARLLDQLLGALEVLHREGVYHRDIAPDNILVAEGAPPVLLDFGAARRVISDRSQSLTAILKPSYAPLEQYAESTGMRQGPWTDFYALGATLHFLITGKAPVPATARAMNDEQPRLGGSGQGGVPDLLLQVCDWMLAPRQQDRPQNAAEVRAALTGHLPVPQRERVASATSWHSTVIQIDDGEPAGSVFAPSELPAPQVHAERRRARSRTLGWAAAAMVIAAAGGIWWASARGPGGDVPSLAQASSVPAADAVAAPTTPIETVATVTAPANPPAPKDAAAPAHTGPEAAAPRTTAAQRRDADNARAAQRAQLARQKAAAAAHGSDAALTRQAAADPSIHAPTTAAGSGSSSAAPEATPSGPTPAPVGVAVATRNPREHCAGRHLVALHRCMVRECEKPEYSAHRECQKVRDIESRTRNLVTN